MIELNEIKLNKDNPRKINETSLKKLIDSIKSFPKMLEINDKSCDNIQWDTYDEDVRFTLRRTNLNVIKK